MKTSKFYYLTETTVVIEYSDWREISILTEFSTHRTLYVSKQLSVIQYRSNTLYHYKLIYNGKKTTLRKNYPWNNSNLKLIQNIHPVLEHVDITVLIYMVFFQVVKNSVLSNKTTCLDNFFLPQKENGDLEWKW